MPFLLYSIENGVTFRRLEEVKLAGSAGPLKRHMDSVSPGRGGWHLAESRLVEMLNRDPIQHALVIDLKPNDTNRVSLLRLRDIWGFKEPGWCPLALRLETYFIDWECPQPADFKNEFQIPESPGDLVHEFLYLNEKWNWGMVGSVNGVLLWPEHFDFFLKQVRGDAPARP